MRMRELKMAKSIQPQVTSIGLATMSDVDVKALDMIEMKE